MIQTKYQLNEGQQTALDWLVPFCLGKQDYRMVLLSGHAGTGKTFNINRVVEKVRDTHPHWNFGMTAPTHKAVRVLKKHSDLRDMLDFGTIHSFLGLKQTINAKGEVEYKAEYNPKFERRIDGIHVLIIDESSMLDDKLFDFIMTELRSNPRLRVIFMGDEKQIPPVGKKQETGEANAIPFLSHRQKSHRIHVLELTEPQRQAKGSQIISYATAIREQHRNQKIVYDLSDSKEEIQVLGTDLNILRELFKQYFCTEAFRQDSDYVKVIAWRNDTVDYFNREIRLLINNAESLPRIIDEECLIMDAPLLRDREIIFTNNEEVVTSDVKIVNKVLKYRLYPLVLKEGDPDVVNKEITVRAYSVMLTDLSNKREHAFIIHEDSEKEFNAMREEIGNAARKCRDEFNKKNLWKQFYAIAEEFAWVKYNYAITAHKSQGSSYDYCISIEVDMDFNRDIEERNRIKYVAATRARKKLYIVR